MTTPSPQKIICLMGPTCSGKTQLAVQLAQRSASHIISVDSAMVYRGMDIGTAKPEPELLAMAPHALIDIRDPADTYSAAQFCSDANEVVDAHEETPLLVGGTMLYFRAFQDGLSLLPPADLNIRAQLLDDAQKKGLDYLHAQLKKYDPIAAQRIHPHDPQRLQRALEVYLSTGKTLTEHHAEAQNKKPKENIVTLIIAPSDRNRLHARIADRFQHMLTQGFIAEVEQLLQRNDISIDTPALRAVGYRQVWQYLTGKLTASEMQESAIIATRQLAKRQFTWLRAWKNAIWFDSEDAQLAEKILKFF